MMGIFAASFTCPLSRQVRSYFV